MLTTWSVLICACMPIAVTNSASNIVMSLYIVSILFILR